MGVDVLLGLQWGDEGKGKVVDYLAPRYDIIARFQGGPNAGHTLEFDNVKHVLHQIPSGIFHPHLKNVIGNGVVLDPVVFRKEVEALQKYGINVKDNLYISQKAQIILPTHRLLDAAYEKAKGNDKIGSTLKGIGPTYQDKVARQGIRVGDVLEKNFKERYNSLVEKHKAILEYYGMEYNDLKEYEDEFFEAVELLKKYHLINSEYFLNTEVDQGKSVLAEGAQGALLDIDFGSYPFVTSSNTMVAGACTGLGIPPHKIDQVYGIFKAYCTRVGSGPFPTELNGSEGEALRSEGNEFGATTGRPRRCGWIDLPALKYAVMLNGVTQLMMMKADVLSAFDEIKVCTHYNINGEPTDVLPFDLGNSSIEPVWKKLPGWQESLDAVQGFENLPAALKQYLSFIEEELSVPVNVLSTGPNRTQTLIKDSSLVAKLGDE